MDKKEIEEKRKLIEQALHGILEGIDWVSSDRGHVYWNDVFDNLNQELRKLEIPTCTKCGRKL